MEGGVDDDIHDIILVTISTIRFCECYFSQIFNQNITPQEDDDHKRTMPLGYSTLGAGLYEQIVAKYNR